LNEHLTNWFAEPDSFIICLLLQENTQTKNKSYLQVVAHVTEP